MRRPSQSIGPLLLSQRGNIFHLNVAGWKMSIQSPQKLPDFSVTENINRLYKVMFKISPQTEVHFIGSHLMRTLPMTDTKANIRNMLSWQFSCLNLAFSHISNHKKTSSAIMLLSQSTFLSSSPNSLPKEKGTSNASLCPLSSTLTDLTTDVSGLDHRGREGKNWICRHTVSGIWSQREAKIHQRWDGALWTSLLWSP